MSNYDLLLTKEEAEKVLRLIAFAREKTGASVDPTILSSYDEAVMNSHHALIFVEAWCKQSIASEEKLGPPPKRLRRRVANGARR